MEEIETLKKKYFLPATNANGSQPSHPAVGRGRVSPLIGGRAYFQVLGEALSQIGTGTTPESNRGHFIYIAGWLLNLADPDKPFLLPGPDGPLPLLDLLKAKARAGVDVRVLAWVSWSLGLFERLELRHENLANIQTVQALRNEPCLASKCCLNVTGHPSGGAHAKLVLIGHPGFTVGFTGGIDLDADRAEPYWLDVQAQIEGPAVAGLYALFRDMWNQVLAYTGERPGQGDPAPFQPRPLAFKTELGTVPSVIPETPTVEERDFQDSPGGEHLVQSLRTAPRFHYSEQALPVLRVAPLAFAPYGIFEIRDALREAILAAERYLYIEDQYFWSEEAMGWIRQALQRKPGLHVILVSGDYQPPGPPLPEGMPVAVLDGLLPGLEPPALQRLAIVRRKGFVHAKTVLVDDRWAMIGSANMARRSLYTDIEHALAFIDPRQQLVQRYRAALWARHFELTKASNGSGEPFRELDQALGLWDPAWDGSLDGPRPAPHFVRLDPQSMQRPAIDAVWYDLVADPDSRQPWYFPLSVDFKAG